MSQYLDTISALISFHYPFSEIQQWLVNVPVWGILDITFKHVLDISPSLLGDVYFGHLPTPVPLKKKYIPEYLELDTSLNHLNLTSLSFLRVLELQSGKKKQKTQGVNPPQWLR